MTIAPFTAENTLLAVMSYNRGEYLRNCMQSIGRHLPGFEAVIFDDHSNDAETRRALADLSATYRVIDCKSPTSLDRGGLHTNMNRAMDVAHESGRKFVFFLQDDMQFVRDLDGDFIDNVNAIFACDEHVAQVCVMFVRGYWPKAAMHSRIGLNREVGYYFPIAQDGWTCGISDCGITSLERVRAKEFRFDSTESGSIVKSQELGLHRADCRDPIMMFTPWPQMSRRPVREEFFSLRTAVRRILIKMQEYGALAGCHPFLPMSPADVVRLKQRPLEEYPVAEEFLSVAAALHKPWWYSACNHISDFKSLKTFFAFDWFTKGPPNYRANVRRKLEADARFEQPLSKV